MIAGRAMKKRRGFLVFEGKEVVGNNFFPIKL